MTDVHLPVFYSPAYTLAGHAFDTTRKAAWVADSLRDRPIPGVHLEEPEPLTGEQVAQVHDAEYVEAVRTGVPRHLAESQSFGWDPGVWKMVLASNGGAVAAARAAMESRRAAGSLSSGLHHARRTRGAGYCTFNGLALATRAAQSAGAKRILIIDLDAHCGGGTHELLGADRGVSQLDVAVSAVDFYSPTGDWTLDLIDQPADYLPTIRRRLAEREAGRSELDLVLYNAGMDPYQGCAIGGLGGISADILVRRERLVVDWCRAESVPVAFVLAGGYAPDEAGRAQLVELHRATIAAAAEQ